MRNLTIKRTKSFVGCLGKMKIYIEDPTSSEISINDTPCRKIGDLKNGEEKTFQVGNESVKIFVIADKISKGFCNEYYQLPEGQEDVFLSGKNKFNPAGGNAFRFDNNESEGISANRKRGTLKGLLILAVAVIVGAVVGYLVSSALFSDKAPEEKNFSSDGLTVTLTDEFSEADYGNFTVVYESNDVAMFAIKEPFSLLDGSESYSLKQYADLVAANNRLGSVDVKTDDGLTYFEYESEVSGNTFRYFAYVYKTDDSFWLVQFATLEDSADKYAEQIAEWAKSVEFDN